MKRARTILLCLFVFTLCCSMSQCFKNDTPGPRTTVHGVVKDYKTGEVFGNVVLQITRETHAFYSQYTDFDTVVTKQNGSYSLTFTPVGSGDFYLYLSDHNYFSQYNNFIYQAPGGPLNLGQDNTVDYLVQKLIGLNLHVINGSTQNRTNFRVLTNGCCYTNDTLFYSNIDFAHVKTDTVLHIRIPQLSQIYINSQYYSGYVTTPGPTVGTLNNVLTIRKTFNSGKNDTTVTITNP